MKPTDILYVANSKNASLFRNDPSFIYRCENPGLALEGNAKNTRFLHISQLNLRDIPKISIFHRPLASFSLFSLLWRLRRRGVTVIADVDDLIFDPSYAGYSPGVLNQQVSLKTTTKRFKRHKRALSWFDGITVSTPPLEQLASTTFPHIPVKCIPNSIHHTWRPQSSDLHKEKPGKILTYFPGTHSHNRDFHILRSPLTRFLNEHPEIQLHITGPLDFSLDVNPVQVIHHERVPYAEYLQLFSAGWVNLAPLENTPFNNCKSALKAIEAGYFGIPTICSPTPDYQRLSQAGAVIANNEQEWYEKLVSLSDPAVYEKATRNLRENTIALADIDFHAGELVNFIDELKQRNTNRFFFSRKTFVAAKQYGRR